MTKKDGFFFSLIIIFISSLSTILANPIAIGPDLSYQSISVLICVFIAVVLIEFGIAYLFVRKNLKKISPLLKSILIINLITFPLTQVLALIFTDFFYIAELFPLVAEIFLLGWQFGKLNKKGILIEKVSNAKIVLISLLMNIITFALGLIFLKTIYNL